MNKLFGIFFCLSAASSSWAAELAASSDISFMKQLTRARMEWITTLAHAQEGTEERRDMFYWNGSSCRNHLGEQGYISLKTSSRDLNLQRRNRLYKDKFGECFNLQSEILYNMDFKAGRLRGALASYADFSETRFDGASLESIVFERSRLDRANFSGAHLRGARLRRATLIGARADGADFTGADLRESKFYGAQFIKTDLSGADMREADLSNGSFNGANFGGVNMEDARLRGTDLGAARFAGASFKSADLSGADLRSSDMRGASTDRADLRGAKYNSCTRFPAGWGPHDPDSRGMVLVREPWDDNPRPRPCP
jgi:uncharacterized protein YjbI with pentapeptide repeats